MKKTYQNPEMKIVRVQLQQMIAASDSVKLGGSYDGSSAIQSRNAGSFWDEDED